MSLFPKILRYPNYSKLYYAGLTSELGSYITETALMLLVFKLSGQDKSYLGIIRVFFLTFLTLGGILGGPLGERYNRRNILIICNIVRIPLILAIIIYPKIWIIILANSLVALCTGIYNPARQTMVNDIVPPKDINSANSLFSSTMAVLHLVGPLIGALAFAHFGGVDEVLSFDLLTYFLGIFLLARLKYTPPPKEEASSEAQPNFLKDIIDGFRYIKKRNDLFALLLNTFFAGLSIGILIPLILPFVQETMGRGDKEYGYLMALFGAGGVIGGILSNKLSKKFKVGGIIITTIALEPIMMILWINTYNFYLSAFLFFIWGIIVFTRIPAQLNYISETVETEFLTRTYSLMDMAFVIPNISGGLIIGLAGDTYSSFQILSVATALFVISIFGRLGTKNMRALFRSDAKKVTRNSLSRDSLA